ncbi:hypothetical protein AJ88_46905 [Mesorhizobium amorphae CCBAU 01583]|nr:hypothetical protein AJ88_46905 [Mesorhizobium amorphae CCBAU 01583]
MRKTSSIAAQAARATKGLARSPGHAGVCEGLPAPSSKTEGSRGFDRTASQPRGAAPHLRPFEPRPIVNYGKRYRAGLRVATTLAESAVNSVVGKRMVKKQQMRWSLHGAHMLMQVRAAEINGELRTGCGRLSDNQN